MRIFCTYCGTAQELAAPPPSVTCAQCGKTFVVAGGGSPGAPVPAPKKAPSVPLLLALGGLGCLGLLVVPGILAAIAIPNFIKFQSRSKQAEAKANLRALYTAERAFYEENQRYTSDLEELGAHLEPGNRYAYFADERGVLVAVDRHRHPGQTAVGLADLPPLPEARPGVTGTCPKCELTLVAAGNIDSDPTLDVWSISTAERTGSSGASIAAGSAHQEVDDVRN